MRCACVASRPWVWSPAAIAAGSLNAFPAIKRLKKMANGSTWAKFWKVAFMPAPAPRVAAREAVHDRGPVGGGERVH
jgi:hypothetical protein